MRAHAVYAVDSLLMPRPREWNYRRIALSGIEGDSSLSLRGADQSFFVGNLERDFSVNTSFRQSPKIAVPQHGFISPPLSSVLRI